MEEKKLAYESINRFESRVAKVKLAILERKLLYISLIAPIISLLSIALPKFRHYNRYDKELRIFCSLSIIILGGVCLYYYDSVH